MKLLVDLMEQKEDLSKLPEDVIKTLKKHVRDGANDLELEIINAMDLLNKAYKCEGVQNPTPSEKTAWEQYEDLLQYAVKELAEARKGFDKSWRMSSEVFREMKESMEKKIKVRVVEVGDKFGKGHTVEVNNMETVIEMIRKQAGEKAYDMDIDDHGNGACTCKFSYQGIQRPYKVKLQRL